MLTPFALATSAIAAVVGPGIGSARSKSAASSRWQKYSNAKSSYKHTTRAPRSAASPTKRAVFARFFALSALTAVWTKPSLTSR
jgi:hypothetical protein